ncbi:glycosyltransferase [Marinobacter sp.]|uniref:glycosyltransferase n=1 Tax=Marinobacter sp. TaxID=50741 RepID=UPI003A928CC4
MPESEAPGFIEFLVPGDPGQNTGGYRYVRKLVEALNERGHKARVTGLPGRFPRPDYDALNALDQQLGAMPDGACVVLDGLAMGGLPEVVNKHHERLQLLALVHHPLADETGLSEADRDWLFGAEKRALTFVSGVVTTSRPTAARLADYDVPAAAVRVAEPGVTGVAARASPETEPAHNRVPRLLCVAHLSPRKAQHQLVEALKSLKAIPWHCTLAGSGTRDAVYGKSVRKLIREAGLGSRIELTGELGETELTDLYRQSDFFVFPSLYEGYGMVIDEALAAGLPVISSDGGALASTGARPGVVQYCAGDVRALASRIRCWLESPEELQHARKLARKESRRIRSWQDTATDFMAAIGYFKGFQRDSHQHSEFASAWLAARESADHRARSRQLTETLNGWLCKRYADQEPENQHKPLQIVDLGTGRGSNAVFLVPALQMPQVWLAIDQDAGLLREAKQRVEALDVPLETEIALLTPENMEQHLPREVSLITASALIDLVPESWLRVLADVAVARNSAVLIVLSYAGRFDLFPGHPDDLLLRNLVNRHQHGDKGTGAALGPDACEVLRQVLGEQGYQVELAASPWHLDAGDAELIRMLMEGWVEAAIEQDSDCGPTLTDWLEVRNTQLADGSLRVSVDHIDLLALPPGEASWPT